MIWSFSNSLQNNVIHAGAFLQENEGDKMNEKAMDDDVEQYESLFGPIQLDYID